jgi:hypothetical protein
MSRVKRSALREPKIYPVSKAVSWRNETAVAVHYNRHVHFTNCTVQLILRSDRHCFIFWQVQDSSHSRLPSFQSGTETHQPLILWVLGVGGGGSGYRVQKVTPNSHTSLVPMLKMSIFLPFWHTRSSFLNTDKFKIFSFNFILYFATHHRLWKP